MAEEFLLVTATVFLLLSASIHLGPPGARNVSPSPHPVRTHGYNLVYALRILRIHLISVMFFLTPHGDDYGNVFHE
jgi:hypothetical protein